MATQEYPGEDLQSSLIFGSIEQPQQQHQHTFANTNVSNNLSNFLLDESAADNPPAYRPPVDNRVTSAPNMSSSANLNSASLSQMYSQNSPAVSPPSSNQYQGLQPPQAGNTVSAPIVLPQQFQQQQPQQQVYAKPQPAPSPAPYLSAPYAQNNTPPQSAEIPQMTWNGQPIQQVPHPAVSNVQAGVTNMGSPVSSGHFSPIERPGTLQQYTLQQPEVQAPKMQYAAPSVVEAKKPASEGGIQALLDQYPNPQAEQSKVKGSIDLLLKKFDDHAEKMQQIMARFDQRLSNLEVVTKDLSDRVGGTSAPSHSHSHSSRNAEPKYPPIAKSSASPKKKKKAAKRPSSKSFSTPPKSKDSSAADEELARKLQAEFDQEASDSEGVSSSYSSGTVQQILSDEEYAQRLQSAYLRREYASAKKNGKESKKDADKKEDDSDKPQSTLWSRLFGQKQQKDGEDGKEMETLKKSSKKEKSPAKPTLATQVNSGTVAQPQMQALQYAYYPQFPFLTPGTVGQNGMQYVPLGAPGNQYVLTNPQ